MLHMAPSRLTAQLPHGTQCLPLGVTLCVHVSPSISSYWAVWNGLFLRGDRATVQRHLCVRCIRGRTRVDSMRAESKRRSQAATASGLPNGAEVSLTLSSFLALSIPLDRQDHPHPHIHTHDLMLQWPTTTTKKKKHPTPGHRWSSECQKKYAVGCLVW